MQMIKQKSLPGQAPSSPIKQRIEKIHQRYEQLVILVSEGNVDSLSSLVSAGETNSEVDNSVSQNMSTNTMTEADCMAFTSLQGFAASLDGEGRVQILYIPGGEEELARWIVALMIQHAHGWEIENGAIDLFRPCHDESQVSAPSLYSIPSPFLPILSTLRQPRAKRSSFFSDDDDDGNEGCSGNGSFGRLG